MGNLLEYFSKNRYQPSFFIGDRVFGHWNKIPFIGTVGVDSLISEEEGPRVSVLLDLPIQHNGNIRTIVVVKPKSIKPLVKF